MTDYQVYGVRHFLRRLDAEGASELRRRLVVLNDGSLLPKGASADIDRFRLDSVLVYRTLVLRTGPAASRPSSLYRRVWHGRWYDVWQRREPMRRRIVEHLSLGDTAQAAAVPSCTEVLRLSKLGPLAAVTREEEVPVAPDGAVDARRGGEYEVWVTGSFRGRAEVNVDGSRLATRRHQLNWPGLASPFGGVKLGPGRHRVAVRVGGPTWRPGSGGTGYGVGGTTLTPDDPDRPVVVVPAPRARTLCGKRLDWIEALAAP
jgi:hypothetical protein